MTQAFRKSEPEKGWIPAKHGSRLYVSDKIRKMASASALIAAARRRAALSQEELAERAGTSRTAISAYEAGTKDPRSETVERLIEAAGFRLELVPTIDWSTLGTGRKTFSCPSVLPRLEPGGSVATIELPHHLSWSGRREFSLSDRKDRERVYEIVLTEGLPEDIETFVDGGLLVDLWEDLYLRRDIRSAWQPLIDEGLQWLNSVTPNSMSPPRSSRSANQMVSS